MKTIMIMILVAAMSSCASARTERIADFRELTKDICIESPNEILLAQALYREMVLDVR
tara:strand:+ start:3919 stop:4092 length:174 start_codon:yes stop_codon:yes gene_type:complete